uniref:Ovule protein n=1 Tax=Mesocestoides corti TaxID=53468 RepID=A0A5K3FJZ1_MESCO
MKRPFYKSTRAKSLVYYSLGPLSCQMWGIRECRTGLFVNHQRCKEPSQKPILCLFVFQWHARKISSQPEKDTNEVQYIISGVASVVDLDGRARVFYSTEE